MVYPQTSQLRKRFNHRHIKEDNGVPTDVFIKKIVQPQASKERKWFNHTHLKAQPKTSK